MDRIDAIGLACPQPVLLVLEKLNTASAPFEVAVNTQAAVENITRAVESKGKTVSDVRTEGETSVLTISL